MLATAGLMFTLCNTSHAALIDYGAFTTDSNTGLDWLDLTATSGKSYDDVESQMNSGLLYEGWRHANRAEVRDFWFDAGGLAPFTGIALGDINWVGRLQILWGKTYPFTYTVNGNTVQGTIAMTNDVSLACATCNLTVYLLDNIDISDSSLGDFAEAQQLNEAYRWQGQAPIGHALVRNSVVAVPEPTTIALFGLGIAGIAILRRKQRLNGQGHNNKGIRI